MANAAQLGRVFSLYLGTTAPTTADDSADANYTEHLLVTEHSVNTSRNAIESSTKDDGIDSCFVAGRKNNVLNLTAQFDPTFTADGHDELMTALNAIDGTVHFLLTTDVTGEWEAFGQGIVTARNITMPDEGISTLQVTIQVNGAMTEQAAA